MGQEQSRKVDFHVLMKNCTHYILQLEGDPTVKLGKLETTPHAIPPSTDGQTQQIHSSTINSRDDIILEIWYTYRFMNTPGEAKWYLKIFCELHWDEEDKLDTEQTFAVDLLFKRASSFAIQIFKDDMMIAQENLRENNLYCRFRNPNCLFSTEVVDEPGTNHCHNISVKIEVDSVQAKIQGNPPKLPQFRHLWTGKTILLWLVVSALVSAAALGLAWITGTVDALLRWFGSTTTHVLGVIATAVTSAIMNWIMRMVNDGLHGRG